MARKNVNFDKFKLFYVEKKTDGPWIEHPLDIVPMLQKISGEPPKPETQTIYGEHYRFHVCKCDDISNTWEIQILHLREKIIPGIAGFTGNYDLIELPDGKFVAESCTMLYDANNKELYMQRNIYCMSPNRFGIYLSLIYPEGTQVIIKPVINGNALEKITKEKRYRKVLLVSDSEQGQIASTGRLKKLLDNYQDYHGRILKIDIGMGRGSGYLSANETVELIREAYSEAAISKLEVKMSDPDDREVNTLDLINDRVTIIIPISYSRENPITHSRLYSELKQRAL